MINVHVVPPVRSYDLLLSFGDLQAIAEHGQVPRHFTEKSSTRSRLLSYTLVNVLTKRAQQAVQHAVRVLVQLLVGLVHELDQRKENHKNVLAGSLAENLVVVVLKFKR